MVNGQKVGDVCYSNGTYMKQLMMMVAALVMMVMLVVIPDTLMMIVTRVCLAGLQSHYISNYRIICVTGCFLSPS